MKKAKQIIAGDNQKREVVLKILEMLNGESFNDAKEILELSQHYMKENTFLDYDLAREMIQAEAIEGD